MTAGDCPNRSEYIYGWGGMLRHACHQHTNAMAAIARAIGSPFSAEPDHAGMAIARMCDHKDDLPKEEGDDD